MKKPFSSPPLGWNSYDCYGIFANEEVLLKNLEAFVATLAPAGYEYFVLDAGWYHDFENNEITGFPFDTSTPSKTYLDDYGVLSPSPSLFPSGLRHVVDRVHAEGLKFGLHIMRGIPRKAVELNLPIRGSSATAADIANQQDLCSWCSLMYGIDMQRPGAQAYYDSVVQALADLGVDFIKADDITQFPEEILALTDAIRRIKPDMVLSLSPGDFTADLNMDVYRNAHMLRVSGDVWDERQDLQVCFNRWDHYQRFGKPGFWLDMDMIPFGALSVYAPEEQQAASFKEERYSGKGWKRQSKLTPEQKRTFITMRALAASPLFMGGELTMTPEEDFELITHPEMLRCNQNGVVGKRIYAQRNIDVRKTVSLEDPAHGWIGVFNRHEESTVFSLSREDLQNAGDYLHDIWNDKAVSLEQNRMSGKLEPDDVLFLKY